jgi:hypothetical protein
VLFFLPTSPISPPMEMVIPGGSSSRINEASSAQRS